ncbi:MAG: FAD:protein FMN transferase [Caldilineaceae bacterium]
MKQETANRQHSHHFRAMGTDVALWLWNSSEQRARNALLAAEGFFAQTEARLSRFRADSELSRLNRAAGKPFAASPVLFELVAEALAWRDRTGGIFDPAVLNALIASGYDRTFTAIKAEDGNTGESGTRVSADVGAGFTGASQKMRVDSSAIELGPGRRILLPEGVGIDLGGIAKGWTIQQAAHRLGMWGPCLVDAGGDIACVGKPPGEPWVVTVADPRVEDEYADEDIAVVSLSNAAIATSSRIYRSWRQGGRAAHHLIDPRTGAPAATNIYSVTVLADRLPDAEIHAKTALILGDEQGLAYLNQLAGAAALVVTDDGRHLTTGNFEQKAYVPSSTIPGSSFAARFATPV